MRTKSGVAQGLLATVACVTAVAVFWRQLLLPDSDFSQHAAFARLLCRGGGAPPHFLFELLVCSLTAPVHRIRSLDGASVALTTVAVAAAAVVAKAVLTFWRLRAVAAPGAALAAGTCLLFAMPLFNWWSFPEVYLGQISPNVWHNPTAIAVLPLAFLLFHATARLAVAAGPVPWRTAAPSGVLAVLIALLKPNYLLALFPCWLALLAIRLRRRRPPAGAAGWRLAAIEAILLIAPAAGVLAWQAWRMTVTGGAVMIAPLAVWRLYSPDIPASIVLSIAFPVSVLIAMAGRRPPAPPRLPAETIARPGGWFAATSDRVDRRLALAWGVLLVAVLQMALLAEPGPRYSHANYFWAAHTANYLLFVESAAALLTAPRSWCSRTAWGLLGLHTLAGLTYLAVPMMGWF